MQHTEAGGGGGWKGILFLVLQIQTRKTEEASQTKKTQGLKALISYSMILILLPFIIILLNDTSQSDVQIQMVFTLFHYNV